jgi:hypothetical protein
LLRVHLQVLLTLTLGWAPLPRSGSADGRFALCNPLTRAGAGGARLCCTLAGWGGRPGAGAEALCVAESEKSKGFCCNTTCIICTSSSLMTCNTVQITYA